MTAIVTLGQFDGVHRGHQALLARCVALAKKQGSTSVVVTFDRHPAAVVRPDAVPAVLTVLDRKIELLRRAGLDSLLVLRFDRARSEQSPEDFVRTVLVDRLHAERVVVGGDFHFGHRRLGNTALLRQLGGRYGFDVETFPPVFFDDEPVSSTRIRRAITCGELDAANNLLTRPHELSGVVVAGDGRGRQLGFPTANVHVSSTLCIPSDGVYAGEYVFPDGSAQPTAISIGTRPTYYSEGQCLVEAFVLDFDGDLYGQRTTLRFHHRLRGQKRFSDSTELIEEMNRDVETTKKLLSS